MTILPNPDRHPSVFIWCVLVGIALGVLGHMGWTNQDRIDEQFAAKLLLERERAKANCHAEGKDR